MPGCVAGASPPVPVCVVAARGTLIVSRRRGRAGRAHEERSDAGGRPHGLAPSAGRDVPDAAEDCLRCGGGLAIAQPCWCEASRYRGGHSIDWQRRTTSTAHRRGLFRDVRKQAGPSHWVLESDPSICRSPASFAARRYEVNTDRRRRVGLKQGGYKTTSRHDSTLDRWYSEVPTGAVKAGNEISARSQDLAGDDRRMWLTAETIERPRAERNRQIEVLAAIRHGGTVARTTVTMRVPHRRTERSIRRADRHVMPPRAASDDAFRYRGG
jgi:hypothetical protein